MVGERVTDWPTLRAAWVGGVVWSTGLELAQRRFKSYPIHHGVMARCNGVRERGHDTHDVSLSLPHGLRTPSRRLRQVWQTVVQRPSDGQAGRARRVVTLVDTGQSRRRTERLL